MVNLLKVIKKDKKVETHLVFCDFETILIDKTHVVACYSICTKFYKKKKVEEFSSNKMVKKGCEEDILKNSEKLMKEFLDECFKINILHKQKAIFFFHNLHKFDGSFIMDYLYRREDGKYIEESIIRNDCIYMMKITRVKDKISITFKDSFLIIPMSLKELSQTFNKTYQKYSINHERNLETLNDNKSRKEILRYCINDTQALQESFLCFQDLIYENFSIDCAKGLSLPNLAMRIFRSNFYSGNIENLSEGRDILIRKSYFGGNAEIYRPMLKEGFLYDINALYPSVMEKYDFPINAGKMIWGEDIEDIEDFFGFIMCDVNCPETLDKPLLPFRKKDGSVVCPVGNWSGFYFSEEIKACLKLGYTFKLKRGISYERGKIFKEAINVLYKKRIEAERNTPMNKTMKLIMNSIYGRFGMKKVSLKTKIVDQKTLNHLNMYYSYVDETANIGSKTKVTYNPCELDERFIRESIEENKITREEAEAIIKESSKGMYSKGIHGVQISSAISSYARIEIHKFRNNDKIGVCYSDTDSIFCENALEDHEVSQNDLGKMKFEGRIFNGLFISPKVYCYKVNPEASAELKTRGITKGIITEEDFLNIYENQIFPAGRMTKSFTRGRDFKIRETESKYSISGIFSNREKVFDEEGKWIKTRPVRVNKGEVIEDEKKLND